MMRFREIKAALVAVLQARAIATGKFRVIGAQEEQMSAGENLENNKSVQVFYKRGELPESEHGSSDGFKHDMTYGIELTVAEGARGDLNALVNPGSPGDVVTALNDF